MVYPSYRAVLPAVRSESILSARSSRTVPDACGRGLGSDFEGPEETASTDYWALAVQDGIARDSLFFA